MYGWVCLAEDNKALFLGTYICYKFCLHEEEGMGSETKTMFIPAHEFQMTYLVH